VSTQAALVCSSQLYFAESRYDEKGFIWLTSGAMLFLETLAKVVHALLVTLLSFTKASSVIDHYSVTILVRNFPTTWPSCSAHSSSKFTPLPISLRTTFDSPPFLTDCFSSFWTFPALSRCIILPLSLQVPSSYQPTPSVFLFYHSSPSHSQLSSQDSPTSFLRSAGPYTSLLPLLWLGV